MNTSPHMNLYGGSFGYPEPPICATSALRHWCAAIVYALIGWCLLGTVVRDITPSGLIYGLIVFQTIRLWVTEFKTTIRLSTGVSFLVLYAVYGPNLLVFDRIDASLTISYFIVFVDAIVYFSGTKYPYRQSASDQSRVLSWLGLIVSCGALALAFAIVQRTDLGLMVPLGFALFFQESLLRKSVSRTKAFIALGLIEISIFFYLVFFWSGFGRLAVASLLLLPVALHSAYRPTLLRFWHLVVAMPALITIAALVRGEGGVTSALAIGVTDHMKLTEDLRSGFLVGDGKIQSLWEQYQLFFLNWVPRDLWVGKPVGAGLYAVDVFWGRSQYGDEHSISLGFVGDQIFTIGPWYPLGLILLLATIVQVRRLLFASSNKINRAPLAAFDCMLLSYFWGGMASFGSRVWFVVLPLIILALLSKLFERGKPAEPSDLVLNHTRAIPRAG